MVARRVHLSALTPEEVEVMNSPKFREKRATWVAAGGLSLADASELRRWIPYTKDMDTILSSPVNIFVFSVRRHGSKYGVISKKQHTAIKTYLAKSSGGAEHGTLTDEETTRIWALPDLSEKVHRMKRMCIGGAPLSERQISYLRALLREIGSYHPTIQEARTIRTLDNAEPLKRHYTTYHVLTPGLRERLSSLSIPGRHKKRT